MKRKLKFIIVFFAVTSATYAQRMLGDVDPNDFRMPQQDPQQLWKVFWGIVILVFIIVLSQFISSRKVKKHEEQISKKKFLDLASKRKITDAEKEIIYKIREGLKHNNVYELVTKKHVFNRLVDDFIVKYVEKQKPERKARLYSDLTSLRRKLKFHVPLKYETLSTTKELPINTPIILQIGTRLYRSVIMDNTEESLMIDPPDENAGKNLKSGTSVQISFYRKSDGHYKIHTTVLKYMPNPMNTIAVSHTHKIKGAIKRKTVRADYFDVCEMTSLGSNPLVQSGKESHDPIKAETRNFSTGGICVVSYEDIKIGSYLLLKFHVDSKYKFNHLKAKMLKKKKLSRKYMYNLKFMGIPKEMKEEIRRAVNHVNRINKHKT